MVIVIQLSNARGTEREEREIADHLKGDARACALDEAVREVTERWMLGIGDSIRVFDRDADGGELGPVVEKMKECGWFEADGVVQHPQGHVFTTWKDAVFSCYRSCQRDLTMNTAIPLWQSEFSDFDAATMPAIPAHWRDESWHNDVSPSFIAKGDAETHVRVWIDYSDPQMRMLAPDGKRFAVSRYIDGEFDGVLLESDDWDEIVRCAESAGLNR